MEADVIACEPLVQPSKDGDELLKQTSKPVTVLQRRLNTVDATVRSVTAMRTRWWSSRAVVTLRDPVLARLCVRPSSLHWFHTRITVVAAYPVRAAMSNLLHGDLPFCPVRMHSLADIEPFRVDEAYMH